VYTWGIQGAQVPQQKGKKMTKTIYASELGKCVAKKDNYRAYKDGGIYAIYSVCREMIWDKDYNCTFGTKLEAVHVGYVQDINNFDMAVEELKMEMNYMMKAGN
jgi:DNA-dependent RNA polymerase auxiliary subunit epsilon